MYICIFSTYNIASASAFYQSRLQKNPQNHPHFTPLKIRRSAFYRRPRKYAFSNSVIDDWNLLPASCINCSTINTFKKHLSSELESESVKFKVCQLW